MHKRLKNNRLTISIRPPEKGDQSSDVYIAYSITAEIEGYQSITHSITKIYLNLQHCLRYHCAFVEKCRHCLHFRYSGLIFHRRP